MDVPARLTLDATFAFFIPIFWPFIPWYLGGSFERFMGLRTGMVARAKIGIAGTLILGAPRALPLLGFATVNSLDEHLPFPLRLVIGVMAWLAASVVLYPLYAAPLEMLDRDAGLLDGFVSSAARSSRAPLQRMVVRAVAVACAGALPWSTMAFADHFPLLALLAALLFFVASPTLTVALVAHAWSDGTERFGAARTPRIDRTPEVALEGSMRRRLAGALALALTPVAVVTCTLLLAILAPAPARTSTVQTRPVRASDLHPDQDRAVQFPTNSGLRTERPRPGLLAISTADGGGAGEVRLPCVSSLTPEAPDETAFRETYRGQQVWTYRLTTATCENRVSFNDEGVRLDDTTSDRITQRWGGSVGVWVALLVALLAALAAFDQLRWLGRARNLDATSKELLGTVALEGRIVGEGVAFTRGGTLHTPSGLRVDLGEHGVLTLPPDGTLTLLHPVREPATLVPGSLLSIITTLRGQQGSPFRDAQTPPPKDVRVVPGSLAQAREAYVQFASRRIALTGLFALLGAVTFAAFGLIHL
jgi:hypothetical protein